MLEIKKILTSDSEYNEIVKNHFFRNPVYSEALKNICISSGVSLYAAINNGKVCGFAAADDATADVCSLMSLSVAPDYRKKALPMQYLTASLRTESRRLWLPNVLKIPSASLRNTAFTQFPLAKNSRAKTLITQLTEIFDFGAKDRAHFMCPAFFI